MAAGMPRCRGSFPLSSPDSRRWSAPTTRRVDRPCRSELTPAEIERALAWQGPRLEFVDMRLSEVVAEFNRYNARKLVVGDRATADILVGGNFRADNVDSFVRLLDVGFGVAAVPRGDEIVLRRRR